MIPLKQKITVWNNFCVKGSHDKISTSVVRLKISKPLVYNSKEHKRVQKQWVDQGNINMWNKLCFKDSHYKFMSQDPMFQELAEPIGFFLISQNTSFWKLIYVL